MILCDRHGTALYDILEGYGLKPWMPVNLDDAARRAGLWLQGCRTLETFDPLTAASLNLYLAFTETLPHLAYEMPDDGCPVCFTNEDHVQACDAPAGECRFTADAWLTFAAEETAGEWLEMRRCR